MFRPEDNPPPPATRDLPFNGPATAPVQVRQLGTPRAADMSFRQGQRFGEGGAPNPVLQPLKTKPMAIVNYKVAATGQALAVLLTTGADSPLPR